MAQRQLFVAHQLANAIFATCVLGLLLGDRLDAATTMVFAWMPLDAAVVLLQRAVGGVPHARAASVLAHHACTALLCAEAHAFLPAHHHHRDRITRSMLLYELSTPAVCLHNAFPDAFPKKLRNLVWALVRVPLSARVLWVAHAYTADAGYERARRPVLLMLALVALTVAWTVGSPKSRFASLLCALPPLHATIVAGDWQLATLLALLVASSFAFYARGVEFPDKLSICAVMTQVAARRGAALSLVTAFAVLGPLAPARRRVVTNAWVAWAAWAASWRVGRSDDRLDAPMLALCGAVMVGCILLLGGPRHLSFGGLIVWHTAAAGLLSSVM